jgi:hypothetical protein
LAGLADVATGNALISGGVGANPSYGKIGLTTHVSGTLPVGSGGTGTTTLTGYLKGNGTSAFTAVASVPSSDITGLGTMSTQNSSSVTITGGTINGTTIGATTRSTGAFTTLTANSNATFTGGAGKNAFGSVDGQAIVAINSNATGSTTVYGLHIIPSVQTDVTSDYYGVRFAPILAAGTAIAGTAGGFVVSGGSLGAGATVGTLTGFSVAGTLTQGTNNYGFRSAIPSATGRWNFYADGTANNAFSGSSRFGSTTAPTATVDITGTLAVSSTVSGAGFTSYFASPPAIGGTVAAAGSFTTLTASTSVTVSGVAVPTISSTDTLTNKRVTPRVVTSGTTTGNQTPTGDTADQYVMTGLTGAITILAPSGTPTDGQKLILRILDNGTARAITWTTTSGAYRVVGTTLPTTTVASKVIYVGCIYNSTATFWDVVSVAQQA